MNQRPSEPELALRTPGAPDVSDTSGTSGGVDSSTGLLAWFAAQHPAAGSAVMATGIVSTGLRQVGAHVLSAVALAQAALLWLALADDFGRRLLRQRQRWTSESHTPPALTAVASTTVLGVRISLEGWQPVAVVLLIVATRPCGRAAVPSLRRLAAEPRRMLSSDPSAPPVMMIGPSAPNGTRSWTAERAHGSGAAHTTDDP